THLSPQLRLLRSHPREITLLRRCDQVSHGLVKRFLLAFSSSRNTPCVSRVSPWTSNTDSSPDSPTDSTASVATQPASESIATNKTPALPATNRHATPRARVAAA